MGRLERAARVWVVVLALVLGSAGVAGAGGGGHGRGGWHGGGGHGWHGGGHGWHGSSGVRVVVPFYYGAGPFWGPGWWARPYPAYAYPPYGYAPYGYAPYAYPPAGGAVVIQPQTQTYVQQQPQYWYYCRNPEGYYPYVEQCPSGWMTVVPPAAPQD